MTEAEWLRIDVRRLPRAFWFGLLLEAIAGVVLVLLRDPFGLMGIIPGIAFVAGMVLCYRGIVEGRSQV
jgi:drug/metabolite transporter (DMT)-like permease